MFRASFHWLLLAFQVFLGVFRIIQGSPASPYHAMDARPNHLFPCSASKQCVLCAGPCTVNEGDNEINQAWALPFRGSQVLEEDKGGEHRP